MSQQPVWKYAGHVGAIDPIAYGGGFVYVDETGVYAPELTWFEPAEDEDWKEYGGKAKLQTFRTILENYPEDEWWWEKLAGMASFTGMSVETLQDDARSNNPVARARVYMDLIAYFGSENFDSYPVSMAEDEAYAHYAEEMKQARRHC